MICIPYSGTWDTSDLLDRQEVVPYATKAYQVWAPRSASSLGAVFERGGEAAAGLMRMNYYGGVAAACSVRWCL